VFWKIEIVDWMLLALWWSKWNESNKQASKQCMEINEESTCNQLTRKILLNLVKELYEEEENKNRINKKINKMKW